MGVGVGGEEFTLGDTVRHWGDRRLFVVSLIGVRGEAEEVRFLGLIVFVFCCFGLGIDLEVADHAWPNRGDLFD